MLLPKKNIPLIFYISISLFSLLLLIPFFVYASPNECPVNIYPKPTSGEGDYIISIKNNNSQLIYSVLVNFIPPDNSFISYSGVNFPIGWERASSIWYALHSETTTDPIAQGNYISFPVHANISTYFDGIDVGFGSSFGNWLCSGHYSPNEITYDKNPFKEVFVNLDVPYFSQNNPLWGKKEYDHSIKLGFTDPTIDRWGCAVTSAAMVLNFHNIKQLPNGDNLDPGSLNVWLKNNNGYATGYKNMDGWYSYLKFPSISTLTQKIFNAGKSDTKLEYQRKTNNLTDVLDNDLNVLKFPDILKVSNNITSSHFVVAKGKLDNTYSINDPEWNNSTLESFNNTFNHLDRFIPSNTDLSYILAVINPSVEMMITSPNDKKTGKDLSNNEELNNIEDASYSLQLPISNPNNSDQNENLGTSVNEFLLPKPADGNYKVKLSSKKDGFYEINLATFKENGDNESNYVRGIISKNQYETIIINYSKTGNSYVTKTLEDLIIDLNELKKINQFKNNGIYNSLFIKATLTNLSNSINKNVSINILKSMLNELNAQKGKGISEDAYQILFYDINSIIN